MIFVCSPVGHGMRWGINYGDRYLHTWVMRLGQELPGKQMQNESGVKAIDEGFIVTPRMQQELVEELRNGRDCIVVEIHLCFESVRQELIPWLRRHVPEVEIKWMCFRKNLEKANANVWRRPDRDPARHIAINHSVAQNYTYPPGAEVIDVYEDKAGLETSPPAESARPAM